MACRPRTVPTIVAKDLQAGCREETGCKENRPKWVNAFVFSWMRENGREQTHRGYPPYYQWITAVLAFVFEENVWTAQPSIKDLQAPSGDATSSGVGTKPECALRSTDRLLTVPSREGNVTLRRNVT